MTLATRYVVFSDLDGTLLDAVTYSHGAADEALNELRSHHIPLVLVSSKTRAEMEPLRFRLRLEHPFVVENGGGIVIPKGYFAFPLEEAVLRGEYQVVDRGVPYARLRAVLQELQQSFGRELRGFGDMTSEEIAQHTGLSITEAHLAKQREYDEPFLLEAPSERLEQMRREAHARGLQCVGGGRFFHLMGMQDKGAAVRLLAGWYGRHYGGDEHRPLTVAIGDSPNDLSMFQAVDIPVLVQRPDRSYDDRLQLPQLVRSPAPGPVGWNNSVLKLLREGAP